MDAGHRGDSQNGKFLGTGKHCLMIKLKMGWRTWMLAPAERSEEERGEEDKNGRERGREKDANRQRGDLRPSTYPQSIY